MNKKVTLDQNTVLDIYLDCILVKTEDPSIGIKTDGISLKFRLHPDRLATHQKTIESLIDELPEKFRDPKHGLPFRQALFNHEGTKWTDLETVAEMLITLGIAVGKVERVHLKTTKHFPVDAHFFTIK